MSFFSEACNYLLVYEYVISTEISSDTWDTMKRAISARGLAGTPRAKSANRTLLLGGRRDGYICVFDMETGKIDFEIEVQLFDKAIVSQHCIATKQHA